ncbi:hypothetical protein TVAG_362720 [Trichomonas vaginalis G3]|uniref:Uncharacterized protein n=1 Tax=Trichomonas vaginalis (strain ATCC PRA-98 / G3) TaxID=412133 RepID=A2E650_TRIV3|nr:hypothetical protein TVAGG3_0366450 [Trichomonas vaginalis G3]EAY11892.1 hypothetical protein TVAG_362720 [Trichomonas vaginalis G3]KAI5532308.1 hypothetical protein TVAGG3_0366450 [Trichomonas vaginalis G3]|eukprot:XP_001324115.1 hypothetical protein [Trichomonas vaginalis G3]
MCDCGNIKINSQEYEFGEQIACTETDFNRLSKEGNSIVVAQPSEIVIEKTDKTSIVSDGSQMFELVCQNCKECFRIVPCKHVAYCCKVGVQTESLQSFKNQMNSARPISDFFPLALRPFIETSTKTPNSSISEPKIASMMLPKYKKDYYVDDSDDSERDFQLMFKNKNECIVGSFTHQWMY